MESNIVPEVTIPDVDTDEPCEIDPPLKYTYNSKEEAVAAIHKSGLKNGVDWVLKSHKKTFGSQLYNYFLVQCARFGKYRNSRNLSSPARKRNTNSKRAGCSASFILRQTKEKTWVIRYPQNEKKAFAHNHTSAEQLEVLTGAKQRQLQKDNAINEEVIRHFESGLTPAESASTIWKRDKNNLITPKDISNIRLRHNMDRVGRAGKVQAAFSILKENNYWFRYLEEEQTLRHLIWIHPKSIELFRKAPDVLLFDCTFKTNQYNLPLMNIVAPSGNNSTIHLGCALIDGAKQIDYEWVLNALKDCLREHGLLYELRVILVDREQVSLTINYLI